MADREHLAKLRLGTDAWNNWVEKLDLIPDLSGARLANSDLRNANLKDAQLHKADLRGTDLSRATLRAADLTEAKLQGATLRRVSLSGATLHRAKLGGGRTELSVSNLRGADLSYADLRDSNLDRSDFRDANLTGAKLSGAYLGGANLSRANFTDAVLKDANLQYIVAVGTRFTRADLSGSAVYGISAWDLVLDGAIQSNLRITPDADPTIQVDNLEVAQLIYLLLNNQRIRQVIDTITSKVVLILGRFTPERKFILDALRTELRKYDLLPVLFDFDKPSSQSREETIATLAHLSRFVIADITDAKSVLQEVRSIAPNSPSLVVQPIVLASQEEPGMWDFYRNSRSVLQPVRYTSGKELLHGLYDKVISPAEAAAKQLTPRA